MQINPGTLVFQTQYGSMGLVIADNTMIWSYSDGSMYVVTYDDNTPTTFQDLGGFAKYHVSRGIWKIVYRA